MPTLLIYIAGAIVILMIIALVFKKNRSSDSEAEAVKEVLERSLEEVKDENVSMTAELMRLNSLQSETAVRLQEAEKRLQEAGTEKENALQQQREAMNTVLNELRERILSAEEEKKHTEKERDEKQQQITILSTENAALKEENASLKREAENERKRNAESALELENRLKALSESILKDRAEELNTAGAAQLSNTVDPLRRELSEFRSRIEEIQRYSAEQSGRLNIQLSELQKTQSILGSQAENLVSALRRESKSQGMWGEHSLEKVLESSGLEKGVQYEREISCSNENTRGRVDALVHLPGNRCILIDAKCTLNSYIDFVNASGTNDDAAKTKALRAMAAAVKKHIDELKEKDYSSYAQFNCPDFVFMFIPIDNVLTETLNYDASIFDYAVQHAVYPVTPSTLLPSLRVVSALWILSGQNEKLKALVENADRIFNKSKRVAEILKDVNKSHEMLSRHLESLNTSYSTGRGNLCGQLASFAANASGLSTEFKDMQSSPALPPGTAAAPDQKTSA